MNALVATVRLQADTLPLIQAIQELEGLCVALPRQIADRIFGAIQSGHRLIGLNVDGQATGANDITIVAQPSQRLQMLLAALRAGECDIVRIESILGHDEPSSPGSVAAPSVAQGPGDVMPPGPATLHKAVTHDS